MFPGTPSPDASPDGDATITPLLCWRGERDEKSLADAPIQD
jgi:hypothetical protein